MTSLTSPVARLDAIAQARRHVMRDGAMLSMPWIAPEVLHSWHRCLRLGLRPQQPVVFDAVSKAQLTRTLEANQPLIAAARPVLEQLGRAIVNTRYFVILTNADGVVVGASGAIDHNDPHADLITRVGTDLSERSIGTTAIGMALTDLQSVWLHRGEHFFDTTSVYSCAGAPLFGPDGQCVGMLDVTGIHAVERPELKHLVTQSAGRIENALLLRQKHALLLRLNWPGNSLGSDADGLLCLGADGHITGSNAVARQMLPDLAGPGQTQRHFGTVFGVAPALLFNAARKSAPFELPLWTGLRLQALTVARAGEPQTQTTQAGAGQRMALRDVQTTLIRQAVLDAQGNVMQAARALGISRATVYRKLGQRPPPSTPLQEVDS